jgi:glycosyltransferase involved in cell wall biosynthesis
MKIGFDAKRAFHNATGLGHYSRDTIRHVAQRFPDATCYLFNPAPASLPASLALPNITEIRPESPLEKASGSLWRRYGISKHVKKLGLDLYHGLSAELPADIEKTSVKKLVTIHDLIFERYPQFYKKVDASFYRSKTIHAAQIADLILAVSLQTKMDLINFYKIPEEKIHVCYQGYHPIYSTNPDYETLQRVKEQFQLHQPFCLFVGTIEARKNLLTAVKAIAPLPEVQLVAVGRNTAYGREVLRYATANGLQHRVKFIEGLDLKSLHALYHLARLFVYPSIIEGFGIPLLEAQASGLPVISSKGGCFAEAGGPHSRYLEYGEVADWTAAINALWHDEGSRNQMQIAGLVHARKFSDAPIADNLASTYSEILSL